MAKKTASLGLAGYSGAKFSNQEQARYQAEDDLRTLHKASEIRRDGSRMKLAKAHAANLVKAVQRGK